MMMHSCLCLPLDTGDKAAQCSHLISSTTAAGNSNAKITPHAKYRQSGLSIRIDRCLLLFMPVLPDGKQQKGGCIAARDLNDVLHPSMVQFMPLLFR